MTAPRFDLVIVGGGPVGLALAAMLAARGRDARGIALVDAKPVDAAARDPRSLALSFGSRQLLSQIGGWPGSATPITQIHVSRAGRFGRTLIDKQDYALPALGYVCRYGELVTRLNAALPTDITTLRPTAVAHHREYDDHVELTLTDGQCLSASVVVQAEGGVFGEQTARRRQRDYRQVAIVATVTASDAPPGRAFERFTDEGPLALLPQDDAYAMVWCMRPATAERLLALDAPGFLAALQRSFGQRVGRFTQVDARHSYPLGLNAGPQAATRTVAIGNAAQTLHPVAGQGLNLGLRDATELARLLARDVSPAAVAEFDMLRQQDRSTTVRITDLMARVFASAPGGSPSQSALGLSLALLDMLPHPRRLLAEQMMFGVR